MIDGVMTLGSGASLNIGSGASLNIEEKGLISSVSAGVKAKIATFTSISNSTSPCTFSAPRKQVFSSDIEVIGMWDMPAAYPEWFTDLRPTTSSESDNGDDWTSAINKAIVMKASGEVSFDRGCYRVRDVIKMNAGINLRGVSGVNFHNVRPDRGSTVLLACVEKTPNVDYYDDYVIYLNVYKDGDSYKQNTNNLSYLQSGTSIENIFFKGSTVTFPKCIISACPCHFNNLSFRNFRQCIKYADMMSVTFANSGGRGRVKLHRTGPTSSTVKTVIIPICGARYLYDNGIAIAGFKWAEEKK